MNFTKYIQLKKLSRNACNVQDFTLYKVFRIISIFISSKSCSDMQSTKKGAKNYKNKLYKNAQK